MGAAVESYLKALLPNHYRRKLDTCLTLFRESVGASMPREEPQADARPRLLADGV